MDMCLFSLHTMFDFVQKMFPEIVAVKGTLQLFGRASGLCINYAKSTTTLIDLDEAALAITDLGCPVVDLPLTYLGIPLTIRNPTAEQCSPWLIELLESSQPGRQGSWTSLADSPS
jgi:hypothetical protein